jgi:hypothetical protein
MKWNIPYRSGMSGLQKNWLNRAAHVSFIASVTLPLPFSNTPERLPERLPPLLQPQAPPARAPPTRALPQASLDSIVGPSHPSTD